MAIALRNITVAFMAPVPRVVLTSPNGEYQQDPGVTHVAILPVAVVANGGPSAAPIARYRINATRVQDGQAVVFEGCRYIGQSQVTQAYRFSDEA